MAKYNIVTALVGNGMEQVGNRVVQEVTWVVQVGNRGGAGR